MAAFLLAIACSTSAVGQAEAVDQKAVDQKAIATAVRQLGDDRFTQRQEAAEFLWQQGRAAEPALRRASRDPDPEVRTRAKRILEDFRYGILPDVSGEILTLLRQFRHGGADARQQAFTKLLEQEKIQTAVRLIEFETHPDVRRFLLTKLFDDENAVDQFVELDSLESLVRAVGADQNQQWRTQTLVRLLFTPKMLDRLGKDGEFDKIKQVIVAEPDPRLRTSMLEAMLRDASTLLTLIERDQLPFIFELVKLEKEKDQRAQMFRVAFAQSATLDAVLKKDKLSELIKLSEETLDVASRQTFIEQLFRTRSVVTALLEKHGLKHLVAMASSAPDAAGRGKLLGHLMVAPAVRDHLNSENDAAYPVQLAQEQENAAARRAYLTVLINYGNIIYTLNDAEALATLWELVKQDDDVNWRVATMSRFLVTSRAESLFDEKEEIEWLLKMLAEQADAQHRSRLLNSVVNNYRVFGRVLEHGGFDPVLKMIQTEDGKIRTQLLSRLIGVPASAQHFKAKKKLDYLLSLVRDEKDKEARHQFRVALFRNYAAMQALVEAEHYDELAKWSRDAEDPVQRAELFASFLQSTAVIQKVTEAKQTAMVVEFAKEQENDTARRNFLAAIFRNGSMMGPLIEADHYDTLAKLARGDEDQAERAKLLSYFFSSPRVMDHAMKQNDAKTLLAFARQPGQDKARRDFVRALLRNQSAVTALVEQGHIDDVLALAQTEKEGYWRSSILGSVMTTPKVIQHLATRNELGKLIAFIRDEPNANNRRQLLYRFLSRSDTLGILIEKGFADAILQLVQDQPVDMRGDLLARYAGNNKVLEHLAKQQRLGLLLGLAEAEEDATVVQRYLQQLLGNSSTVSKLIEHGFFDDLLQVASDREDAAQRAQLLGALFAVPQAAEQLVALRRVELLVEIAQETADEQTRRAYLAKMLANGAAVKALVEHGEFDALARLCFEDKNEASRRTLVAELLLSPEAIEQLKAKDRLASSLEDVLADGDKKKTSNFLQRLLGNGTVVGAYLKAKMLDTVLAAAEEGLSGTRRRELVYRMLMSQPTVERLVVSGKTELVMTLISRESDIRRQGYFLRNLVYNSVALTAVIDAGQYDRLFKLVTAADDPSRASLVRSFLFATPTLAHLAKQGDADTLLQYVKKRDDENVRRYFAQAMIYRREAQPLLENAPLVTALIDSVKQLKENSRKSYVQAMLINSRIRRVLINSGQSDVLLELTSLDADDETRQKRMEQVLFSPSGLVSHHMQRDETDEAETLLVKHADTDRGRITLATYWLVTGKLDDQIRTLREQVEQQAEGVDLRLLVYLLRANGDLSSAREIADRLGDPSLLRAVLVEKQLWREAAAIQAESPAPLPIRISTRSDDGKQEVESLGLLMAYQRLAGDADSSSRSAVLLRKLLEKEPDNKQLAWHVAEALLLNGHVQDGIDVARDADPWKAFNLAWYRHDYERALQIVDWQPGAAFSKEWFDALPAEGDDDKQRALQRFERVQRLVFLLNELGLATDRDRLVKLLTATADELVAAGKPNSSQTQEPYWQLSMTLFRIGQLERGAEVAARGVRHRSMTPGVLYRLYNGQTAAGTNEARAWWTFFAKEHVTESSAELLLRVHGVMQLTPHDRESVAGTIAAAEKHAESFPGAAASTRSWYLYGLGLTCQRVGDYETAARCFRQAGSAAPAAQAELARVLAKQQKWPDAAEQFYLQWELEPDDLAALYLSGDALVRAGDKEVGEQRKRDASRLALNSRARHQLALGMLQAGLKNEALDQLRIILRTAPFEHWELNDAARRLAGSLEESDPAEAVRLWSHYLLGDLRTPFYFLEDRSYLSVPSRVHRLRAQLAVSRNDVDGAQASWRRALAATPGEVEVAEQLVPMLDAADQSKLADDVFDKLFQHYQEASQRYPQSALLHNNLAWLAARCHRQLDVALAHARQAVEIAPDEGGYIDTLAEVHFHRGDRERAIHFSRRSVDLDPDDASLQKQLNRFENDPLP